MLACKTGAKGFGWIKGGQFPAGPDRNAPVESQSDVSNPESFIQEVTEEVRRDRLYSYFRKYGWIPALIVVVPE